MEEMVYLGYQFGTFKDANTGRTVHFASMFTMEPFSANDNPDYHTYGYKGDKHKLASPSVLRGLDLQPLDVVEVYFNSKGAITKVVRKDEAGAEDWMEKLSEAV